MILRNAVSGLALAVAAIASTASSAQTSAPAYPARPILLLVPFAAGGSSELLSRLVGQKLSERTGQQVLVENRPGGAGNIAMEAAARSAPDGYTLILGHIGTLAVNPAMFPKLPYDPVADFAPVSLLAHVPNVVAVHPSVPAKNFREFIALAKAKPGSLNYGSAGNGSAGHLAFEYLKQVAGIDLVHVPYKGTGPMTTDLLAGQTQATFTGAPPLIPHIRQGKLRALAVGSPKRVAGLPDVPTIAESGYPGFETSQWYGILAPARTPASIVSKLSTEIAAAMHSKDVMDRLGADGTQPVGSTPEEFALHIKREMARWGEVVRKGRIHAD